MLCRLCSSITASSSWVHSVRLKCGLCSPGSAREGEAHPALKDYGLWPGTIRCSQHQRACISQLVFLPLKSNRLKFLYLAGARSSRSVIAQGNQRVYLATAGIMAGCVLLVSYGNHESQTVTVTDLVSYYQRCALSMPCEHLLVGSPEEGPSEQHTWTGCIPFTPWQSHFPMPSTCGSSCSGARAQLYRMPMLPPPVSYHV